MAGLTEPLSGHERCASMKVPPKRKGNISSRVHRKLQRARRASMKVPPKRKGNSVGAIFIMSDSECLNESPSEKEGK